ncbi:MAG: ring-cleaving dioxygenase [Ardenticatenaceae bacterium]|nr:ring-cleaving dioxygenase [Ardenticatenaceae bacterium]
MQAVQGLHHITAVASDPQANVDFYHHVLGQRLVKKTVNFDDPGTYHLYYGDEIGTPGTIMTFFPWRHMKRGRLGNGETAAVGYGIRPDSVDFWRKRLAAFNVAVGEVQTRFGAVVIPFEDPDGMRLELVTTTDPATIRPWHDGPIAEEHMLLGFHSVTLWLDEVDQTGQLLVDQLGYERVGQEGARTRYRGASDDVGLFVDLLHRPGEPSGRFGAGSIHHIAFRTVDDGEQQEYLAALRAAGQQVTPVQDRQYFHSIYFRSPGGVLFEIATDAPGFLYDEPLDELGTNLKLPVWYEQHRPRIEAALPVFELKEGEAGGVA